MGQRGGRPGLALGPLGRGFCRLAEPGRKRPRAFQPGDGSPVPRPAGASPDLSVRSGGPASRRRRLVPPRQPLPDAGRKQKLKNSGRRLPRPFLQLVPVGWPPFSYGKRGPFFFPPPFTSRTELIPFYLMMNL